MAAIKALQQWCKIQCDGYRDVSITNMTTSFRDGLAFCALIHRHRPDLIDFDSLSKENIYDNNKLAFQVAENELGIPALLDAEDMVALRVPDRLSMLTYVSQYYNYFHGRSPIGGMGAIKRPAEESNEEPAGKKNQPVAAKVFTSPKPATESQTPKSTNDTKREVLAERANRSGTLSSSCSVCSQHVHLVQRHLVDGKLYHRNCFKCKECSTILLSGTYKPGKLPGTFVCKSHSSVEKPLTTPTPHITIPPQKTQSTTVNRNTNSTLTNRNGPDTSAGKASLTPNASKLDWLAHKSDRTPSRESPATPASTPTPVPAPRTTLALKKTPETTTEKSPFNLKTPTESPVSNSVQKNQEARKRFFESSTSPNSSKNSPSVTDKISTSVSPAASKTLTSVTPAASKTSTSVTPAFFKNSTSLSPAAPKTLTSVTPPFSKTSTSLSPSAPKTLTSVTPAFSKTSTSVSPAASKTLTSVTPAFSKTTTSLSPAAPKTLTSVTPPFSKTSTSVSPAASKTLTSVTPAFSKTTTLLSPAASKTLTSVTPAFSKTSTSGSPASGPSAGAAPSKGRVLLRVGDWAKTQDEEKEKENEREKAKNVISKMVTGNKNNSSSSQSPAGLKANGGNVSPMDSGVKGPSGRVRLKPLDVGVESTGTPSWIKDNNSSRPASQLSSNSKENDTAPSDWRSMLKPVSKPVGTTESINSPKKTEAASSPRASGVGIFQTSGSGPSTNASLGLEHPKEPSASPLKNGTSDLKSASSVSPVIPSGTETHKLHKPDHIPKEEILKELKEIEMNLNELEKRGVELEKELRQSDEDGEEDTLMNDLMVDWFNLIRNKQVYMRRESELVYIAKTQDLEEEQPSVEAELRRLMEKPEHLKTWGDRKREEELMTKLVEIVNDRNAIVEGLDEDRLREEEEDEQLNKLMQDLDVKKEKIKKKSTVSRWFSMRSKKPSVED